MISGIVYGLFALFVIWGFLLGLKRGLIKSTIRIISVIIACVIVIFCVPPITKAILNLDLSNSGFEVGGVAFTTVSGTIINLLSQVSIIAELMSASPTIKAVISSVPMILVNLLLFVFFFYLVKGVLYIIDIIINKIVLKNKPKDYKKHRLAGAFIGAFQAIIVFLFVLIPVTGSMNMVSEAFSLIEGKEVVSNATIQNTTLTTKVNSDEQSVPIEDVMGNASKTIDEYNNIFLFKMFNAVGYRALTDSVYDKLTTITIDSQTETKLRDEVNVVVKLYNGYEKLKDFKVSNMTEADANNATQFIDDAFSSPIIGNVLTELTTEVAKNWTAVNPSEFLTIAKPTLSEDLVSTFDLMLVQLRTDTKADLQNDLKVIVATLKICSDYEVIETINSGTTDNIVAAVGKEGFIENLVGTMANGKVTKQILPAVVDLGLGYAYTSLEIDGSDIKATKTANEVNWNSEKVVLGNLFESLSKTYSSIKLEGAILEKIDLENFGIALVCIRESELLDGVGQDITVKLLECKLLDSVDVSSLVANIKNDTTYADLDFNVMFTTLKSSTNIAKDLKELESGSGNVSSLDTGDVGELIDGLTSGGTQADVLEELASESNLTKSGVDAPTAGAVSGLVGIIKNYDIEDSNAVETPKTEEELQSATGAVEKLLGASKNAKDDKKSYIFGAEETIAKAKMQEFVENITSSAFIYSATINQGEALGFKQGSVTKLSENEVLWMKDVLNALEGLTTINSTQKGQIANMFAISI